MLNLHKDINLKLSQILQGICNETKVAEDLTNEAIIHIREAERRINDLSNIIKKGVITDEEVDDCK